MLPNPEAVYDDVSTHSHPKVAAKVTLREKAAKDVSTHSHPKVAAFYKLSMCLKIAVSTHSHPKVAAPYLKVQRLISSVSTHSHPKVAAFRSTKGYFYCTCFNTQPPEGGCRLFQIWQWLLWCFNTQPPEGGCDCLAVVEHQLITFQHTATRRWLPVAGIALGANQDVSTHSHPKVAAAVLFI